MAPTTVCEQCGTVIDIASAERLVVDDWSHYFCSERCKIQWGDQGELDDDE